MKDAENFLSDLQRLSALDTYLSSFVDGIKSHVKQDGMLHVRLLQHRLQQADLVEQTLTCRTCLEVARFL